MKTVSLYVSDVAYAEFKSLAAQSERPVAQLIREAMSEWLATHRRDGHSLAHVEPIDCGAPLAPYDRADVADEMYAARFEHADP